MPKATDVDAAVLEIVACPLDQTSLAGTQNGLICGKGHAYPVVDGIPVLLDPNVEPTLPDVFASTKRLVQSGTMPLVDDVGAESFVAQWIIRTNGNLYRGIHSSLPRYPIPELPIKPRGSDFLVDIGGNWGRWAISAARAGFDAMVIDPNLEAVLVGRHVAQTLDLDVRYVVGDARSLPIRSASVDTAFSYSVLQHFSKEAAERALLEIARVLEPRGRSVVQMPNVFGIRQATNLLRQRFEGSTNPFRVRYWTPAELVHLGERAVGPSTLAVDGFFSLNARPEDRDLLTPFAAATVGASRLLTQLTKVPAFRWLRDCADSVWLLSERS